MEARENKPLIKVILALSYTAFAFINLGGLARTAFPAANILGGDEAGRVFLYASVFFGLTLWVRSSQLG